MITAFDGFPVEVPGAYTTLVAVAKGVPGSAQGRASRSSRA